MYKAENLLLKALISSYWYYVSLLPYASSEVDRMNLTNLIQKVVTRISDIEGQRV